jgi:hypothetical protein
LTVVCEARIGLLMPKLPKLGLLLLAPRLLVLATDPEAPHACEPCGDAGGCQRAGESSDCSVEWPTTRTPGADANVVHLGRGVDYVGGGDLPGSNTPVSTTDECCKLCLKSPTCKVWVTTDQPVDNCWLKAWPGGVVTNKGLPGIPRTSLRWSGLACECDDSCRPPIPPDAGIGFATVVLVGAALYLGGGAIVQRRGGATGWELLPHRRHWAHLHGLALDGVAFCRSGGSRRRLPAEGKDGLRAPLAGARPSRSSGAEACSGKRAKQKKAKDRGKNGTGRDPPAPLPADRAETDAPAAAPSRPPEPTVATSTAAGSGGRWVHVSQ